MGGGVTAETLGDVVKQEGKCGAMPADRITVCMMEAGHPGPHGWQPISQQEADTYLAWLKDREQ